MRTEKLQGAVTLNGQLVHLTSQEYNPL